MREFDIIVFGATGFTGERVCKYLAQSIGKDMSFAISGRNRSKLEQIQSNLESDCFIVVADVTDPQSLLDMAKQCRVLLNCVGPYRKWGEPVVKACLEAQTHYLDVTGEPEFMERMEHLYAEEAERKNILMVSAAGFDSIPADLGVLYCTEKMKEVGQITSVQSFLSVSSSDSGFVGHYATWESAVLGFASADALRALRKESKKNRPKIPRVGAPIHLSVLPEFSPLAQAWALPFPGSDASVVQRTQASLFSKGITQLPRYYAMFTVSSTFWVAATVCMGSLFGFLAKFELGRNLLLSYPGLFSAGCFTHEGPTQAQMDACSFQTRFFAKGCKSADGPEDLELVVTVSGPEPGYVATPIFIVESCMTILQDYDQLLFSGGVLTPGAAFYGSRLIERLESAGIHFHVDSSNFE